MYPHVCHWVCSCGLTLHSFKAQTRCPLAVTLREVILAGWDTPRNNLPYQVTRHSLVAFCGIAFLLLAEAVRLVALKPALYISQLDTTKLAYLVRRDLVSGQEPIAKGATAPKNLLQFSGRDEPEFGVHLRLPPAGTTPPAFAYVSSLCCCLRTL